MTSNLRDPSQPPGAVVGIDEGTGEGIRNDGRRLKPAAKNPWYVLATIAGEQQEDVFDLALHARNSRYWNGWACSRMSGPERAHLAERLRLPVEELEPWTAEERIEVERAFEQRLGAGIPIPDPADPVDFRDTHVRNLLVFDQCVLAGWANFDGATFSGHAVFDGATFSGHAVFGGVTFSGEAYFRGASFSGEANFHGATFSGDANFHGASFNGFASFTHAIFCWVAVFIGATFSGDASFNDATFSGDASFNDATFSGPVVFGGATFSGPVVFGGATFSGLVAFMGATFSWDAIFPRATFSGPALFHRSTFSGRAWFTGATFSGDALFNGATFDGRADFSDGAFEGPAHFTDARFHGWVPRFYQRRFHQDTDFTTRRENWPEVTQENAADSKRAYTRLRQIMAELHKPDDEQFFGRQEIRCKAFLEGRAYRALYVLYGALSDYGYSVWRPALGLAACFLLPWAVYASYLRNGCGFGGGAEFLKAAGLSFSSLFAFLGLSLLYWADFLREAHWTIQTLAAAQTVLGVVLLFFLGLGLRNRFRLR